MSDKLIDQVQDTKAVEERLQEAWTEVGELQDELRQKNREIIDLRQAKEDLDRNVAELAQQLQVGKHLILCVLLKSLHKTQHITHFFAKIILVCFIKALAPSHLPYSVSHTSLV